MAMLGIDVSENQGTINWKKVKNAGVQFAILRTVKRNGKIDSQLANNIKGCIENGIPADFYKYAYALNETDSEKEATEVIQALISLGIKPSKDVVIWHDVEDDTQMALSAEKLTSICKEFKTTVENAGFSYGLYMGRYDFDKGEVDLSVLGNVHVWLARYYDGYKQKTFGEIPNENYKPSVPNGNLWGWQYTSSGKVSGISGNVDLDIAYYEIKELPKENIAADKNTKSASKIIELAKSWVGRKESDGTHRMIVDIYNAHKPLARGYAVKYTDSWCATFISALSIKLGYTDIIPTECSCQYMIELFKKIGCWRENENFTPHVGDIIFYDWQDDGKGDNTGWSDHVGIIESVSDGYMTIIEGNYNDAVGRRVIAVNARYIRGYGVPKFEAEKISNSEIPNNSKKSIDEIAKDVIDGRYGNGEIRKKKLEAEGYDYEAVRVRVNQIIEEQKYYPKYTGNSQKVDNVLREIGVSEIYVGNKTKRKPIGKANGFPNYTGKQNENLAIISLAKQGKLKKP